MLKFIIENTEDMNYEDLGGKKPVDYIKDPSIAKLFQDNKKSQKCAVYISKSLKRPSKQEQKNDLGNQFDKTRRVKLDGFQLEPKNEKISPSSTHQPKKRRRIIPTSSIILPPGK